MLPTAALVGVLLLAPGRAELAVHVYVLVLLAARPRRRRGRDRRIAGRGGAVGVRRCAGAHGATPPERLRRARQARARGGAGASRAPSTSITGCGPSCARSRRGLLAVRRGVDLERQPERASALLGAETWELVRARPRAAARPLRPGDRHACAAARRRVAGGALMELAELRVAGRPNPGRGRAGRGRQAAAARARPARPPRGRPRPARGLPRPGEDARRTLVRAGDEHGLRAHAVHARPDALPTSPARRSGTSATATSSSGRARSSPTCCSPTRSTARRRRRRRRCSRRCRSAR